MNSTLNIYLSEEEIKQKIENKINEINKQTAILNNLGYMKYVNENFWKIKLSLTLESNSKILELEFDDALSEVNFLILYNIR